MVDELRRSAVDVGTATVSMPQRVQRINTTMARLEAGTLRPRVRVLESERADRRNGLLQVCSGLLALNPEGSWPSHERFGPCSAARVVEHQGVVTLC